jgi:CRP/FNR family transcriptional regulator
MAHHDDIKYLKRINFFYGLKENELGEIAGIVMERKYRKGRIIFMEGEPGEAVFFLKSGRLKVSKQDEEGREHILHYVNPGEVFAEVVLFDGGGYPATAEVLEDAEVGVIRCQDMDNLVIKNPGIALTLLKVMSGRLRFAQQKIMELALKDTTRRLAGTLLKLAEEHGTPGEGGTQICLSLTNQELANLVGTSRETVNRIMGELRRRKAIIVEKQAGIVVNKERLESWL